MKFYNAYLNWRRTVLPASKKDLEWRTLELTGKLIGIDQKLDKLLGFPKTQKQSAVHALQNIDQNTEHYSIAATRLGHMLTFSEDMVIGKSLRETGSFQEDDIGKAIEMLEASGYSISRGLFLDVGANIGTHTLYALQYGFRKAICIEADPDNFRVLKINQLLNDVDLRCMNVCAAASIQSGEVDIELSPTNYGDHRISICQTENNLHDELTWTKKRIQSATLDEILKSLKIQASEISFAWIDTQGHEGHVLGGGDSFVSAQVPFVAEFWPYGLSRSGGWQRFRNILNQSNCDIFDLRDSMQNGRLAMVTIDDLDNLYENMIKNETVQSSPHTDLLVIKHK